MIAVGWLGLLLMSAHPIRPHTVTGILTIIGLMLWFWTGFLTMVLLVFV